MRLRSKTKLCLNTQLAENLGISRIAVYKKVKKGVIKGERIGKIL